MNPRIDLEQTYNTNRDGFASILVTHCYANPQDAADPEFLNCASFAKGFADAKLNNLHPFYRGSNQEVATTIERVSKFLNIAAKFIFMNGGESVPRHPRLEYLGVSPFQRQLERVIEYTLDSFEPALFEFGRSAELPHYFWSNEYNYIPTSLSQFTELLSNHPTARDKQNFNFNANEMQGGHSVTTMTAYCFNYDRIKLVSLVRYFRYID